MNSLFRARFALALALALTLAACAPGSRQAPVATTLPPTATAATEQTPPYVAPQPAETLAPVPPTAPPTATGSPTATPSATAIPAATATPRQTQATQLPPQPTLATQPPSPQQAHAYVFPVRSQGKVSYGRTHHDYPAADIFCPVGSEFVAVTDGVVDYVSETDRWDPAVNDGATRGGLSVAIVGDDSVRYYGSHLSQIAPGIAPGVRVSAGQLLGLTGKSGDARDTDPHLHFGISHPTTPDDWEVRRGEIAPYDYLRAWQRGENLTPKLR